MGIILGTMEKKLEATILHWPVSSALNVLSFKGFGFCECVWLKVSKLWTVVLVSGLACSCDIVFEYC